MKKGFLIVLLVAITAFFVHGCQSGASSSGPDNGKTVGYPAGHDMHPNTGDDQKNEPHPLQGFS